MSKNGERRLFCFERAGGRCEYCNDRLPLRRGTLDHFVPKAKGGTNALDNMRWSCYDCNQEKADMEPSEWMKAVRIRSRVYTSPGGLPLTDRQVILSRLIPRQVLSASQCQR